GGPPRLDEATVAAESRWLDEQLRQIKAYRLVLAEAAEELLAGRSTLDAAVARLAATKRGQDPAWLTSLRKVYPGRSDAGCLAATLLDHARALREDRAAERGAEGHEPTARCPADHQPGDRGCAVRGEDDPTHRGRGAGGLVPSFSFFLLL